MARDQRLDLLKLLRKKKFYKKKQKIFFTKNKSLNSRNVIKEKVKTYNEAKILDLLLQAKKSKDPKRYLLSKGVDIRQLKQKELYLEKLLMSLELKKQLFLLAVLKKCPSPLTLKKL